MKILILEDDPNRNASFMKYLNEHSLTIATTAVAVINALESGYKYDSIFLDHDLGGEQMVDSQESNTGAEVARWMAKSSMSKDTPITIHSLNPAGAENMLNILHEFTMVRRVPFTTLLSTWKTLDSL